MLPPMSEPMPMTEPAAPRILPSPPEAGRGKRPQTEREERQVSGFRRSALPTVLFTATLCKNWVFFCAPTFWDCNSLIIPHCCKYGHLDMRIWTSESITLLKPSSDQRSTTRRNRFRTLQGKVAELWTQGAQGGWWCCLRLSLSSHQKLVLEHQSVPCGQNDSFGWRKEGITSSVCLEEQPCLFKTWV